MASPMTMTEKILARASGKSHVEPGENVWAKVDVLRSGKVRVTGYGFDDAFGPTKKLPSITIPR